jgi:hypothetical protein
VLRRPVEYAQYTSLAFGKRCKQMGVKPSIGTVGFSNDLLCMVSHSRRSQNIECFEVWRSGSTIQYRQANDGPVIAEGRLKLVEK